jgi:hyaluronoglucosaminidase
VRPRLGLRLAPRGVIAVAAILIATAGPPASSQPAVLPDAYVTPPRERRIIPQPKSVRWLDGTFDVTPATRIVVADGAQPEDLYAARELNEEVTAWGWRPLEVVRASSLEASAAGAPIDLRGLIVIGEPSRHPLLAGLLAREALRIDSQDPGPEGYVVKVTTQIVIATGVDRRGAFYAAQTLRQLFAADRGRLSLAAVEVRDWPDHAIRAVHVVLDNYSDVFHTALI